MWQVDSSNEGLVSRQLLSRVLFGERRIESQDGIISQDEIIHASN
jgi:hypothetical protein